MLFVYAQLRAGCPRTTLCDTRPVNIEDEEFYAFQFIIHKRVGSGYVEKEYARQICTVITRS